MDNQQTLAETEKAWLCGFFDGEGNVSMNITNNYSALKGVNTKKHTILVPRLTSTNTCYKTMMQVAKLFKKGDVGTHFSVGRKNSPKHKPIYRVVTNGHKRCLKALPILMSYCTTKLEQLEIMKDWLEYRSENYHYSLTDYDFYLKFCKAVDGKGPNDSTLRRLYESCTAETIYSDGIKKGWKHRSREGTFKDKKHSDETKKKMSESAKTGHYGFKKGRVPWNKGLTMASGS
jgi:hypothetical protein